MGNYCITGSSGRIGKAIYELLLAQGHHLVGFDRLQSTTTDKVGDLRDADALARAFEGMDAVFHTAALHAPHVGIATEHDFASINVEGTEQVLRRAKEAGAKQVILTSTTALYGYACQEDHQASWITEKSVPKPRTIYHRTKLDAEATARDFASDDFSVCVIRMSRCFPEVAQEMAVYRLHRGVDARDVAKAHAQALVYAPRAFSLYNVSGMHPFKSEDCEALKHDAATVIQKRAPSLACHFDLRGWKLPTSIDRVYVASKAMSELNWVPDYGYEEVLKLHDARSLEVLRSVTC